jgi:hypothetical protein
MQNDYIPSNDGQFEVWFNNLVEYVFSKVMVGTPAWTHIPKAEAENLAAAYTAWHTAWLPTQKPHNPVETEAKNDAKKAAKTAIRLFVNRYLRYTPVTDEDRTAMGIPNRDDKPSPIPAPSLQAEADLVFPGIHLLELVKIRKVGIASDDPRSYHGVSVHFGILDAVNGKWRVTAPPATGDDLPHTVFIRKKKIRFDFDGESGKTVYFCLRYENQKGGEDGVGPFGPIIQAVIP